jgi:hypothetical protein
MRKPRRWRAPADDVLRCSNAFKGATRRQGAEIAQQRAGHTTTTHALPRACSLGGMGTSVGRLGPPSVRSAARGERSSPHGIDNFAGDRAADRAARHGTCANAEKPPEELSLGG